MKRLISVSSVCVVLFVGQEARLSAAAPEAQSTFFRHVAASQVAELLSMMDPELRLEVDEPVLQAWVAAFREKLGAVTKIEQFGWSTKAVPRGMIRETKCWIICERGAADSTLTMLDGKLIAFSINSDELDGWFQGPASTALYERLGMRFFEEFLAGRATDAYAMCHPALQKVISAAEFNDIILLVQDKVGALRQATVTGVRFEVGEDQEALFLDFRVAGQTGTVSCEIKIQFVGMKGHLLGFNFQLD